MQHSPEDLKRSLISCIDEENNVTDMAACLVVISLLEHTAITRKILEDTRLGKYVNDIRRKTQDVELSKRLKNLVRKWRDACHSESLNGVTTTSKSSGSRGVSSSRNGKQSISPPLSAPGSVRVPGSGLSPCSFPSSCNTSPVRIISAPTTPSTLPQSSRTLSPNISVAKGSLSTSAYITKGNVISPKLAAHTPALSPGRGTAGRRSTPHSPTLLTPPMQFPGHHSQPGIKSETPYIPCVDNVPKTDAANKRLRKDVVEISEVPLPLKRPKNNLSNGYDDECSRDSVISVLSIDRASRTSGDGGSAIVNVANNKSQKTGRKSGRKRKRGQEPHGSNSIAAGVDPLRQKMAVIGAKSSKVKTTSQLVAELAERKGDLLLARRATRLEEKVKDKEGDQSSLAGADAYSVTQNKMEHMEKFLKSTPGPPIEDDDDDEVTIIEDDDSEPTIIPLSPSPVREVPPILLPQPRPNSPLSNLDLLGITDNETAEEILSRLPALDLNSVIWDDPSDLNTNEDHVIARSIDSDTDLDETATLVKRSEKVELTLVQTLHSTNLECQNGNFDMNGRFREWHELILQKAYQDSPLVVLPYVITDF